MGLSLYSCLLSEPWTLRLHSSIPIPPQQISSYFSPKLHYRFLVPWSPFSKMIPVSNSTLSTASCFRLRSRCEEPKLVWCSLKIFFVLIFSRMVDRLVRGHGMFKSFRWLCLFTWQCSSEILSAFWSFMSLLLKSKGVFCVKHLTSRVFIYYYYLFLS